MKPGPYTIDRRFGAPPDTVLAALRDAVAASRPGDLPPGLRTSNLRLKVRGSKFTLLLEDRSDGPCTDVQGWVLPAGDGDTRVHASAAEDRNWGWSVAVFVGIGLASVLSGQRGGWWIVGFGALLGIVVIIQQRAGAMDHERASYLTDWLHGVLDRLPSPATGAAPSPAGITSEA